MRNLVDVNLSPAWVEALRGHGFDAVHWRDVGNLRAPDTEILRWANDAGRVVLTHDLDFGTLLALTAGSGPSTVQVRTQDVMPNAIAAMVVTAITMHAEALSRGALVTIDELRARVRMLPIRR